MQEEWGEGERKVENVGWECCQWGKKGGGIAVRGGKCIK